MPLTILRLLPTDLGLAKDLIRLWQLDDGITDPEIPNDTYLKHLLSKDSFYLFVALKDSEVVGGLSAYELDMFYRTEKEIFLYEIGVDEGHRREGIARALIEALKEMCREAGIKEIFVGTEIENEAAKQLYVNTGGEMDVQPWFSYKV